MKYSLLKCKVKCPSDSKHYYYLEVRISCLKSLFFFPLHLFNKLETRSFCLRFVWSRRNPPTYLWERWSWMKFGSKHAGGSSHFCLRKSGSEVKKRGGGGGSGNVGNPRLCFEQAGRASRGLPQVAVQRTTSAETGRTETKQTLDAHSQMLNVSRCHACTSPLVNQEHCRMSDSCAATLITSHCDH